MRVKSIMTEIQGRLLSKFFINIGKGYFSSTISVTLIKCLQYAYYKNNAVTPNLDPKSCILTKSYAVVFYVTNNKEYEHINIVKMSEKCFVQTKNFSNRLLIFCFERFWFDLV